MGFQRVCSLDDIWEGDMQGFSVDGKAVLVVNQGGGEVSVYDGNCPHQDYPLAEGEIANGVLICAMHLWQFDIRTGEGVNPTGCKLRSYAARIEDGGVFVDVSALSGE